MKKTRHIKKKLFTALHSVAAICVLAVFLSMASPVIKQARAAVCLCVCAFPEAAVTIALIKAEHNQTKAHFGTALPLPGTPGALSPMGSGELGQHEVFLVKDIFRDRIQPALMMMAEQMTAVMMHQALIIGSFLDARHQQETVRLFQDQIARAHKDYHPSVSMCEFGTNVRSLASSERNAQFDSFALNKQFLNRQLGNLYTNAAEGPTTDRAGNNTSDTAGRLGQFRNNFCYLHDLNKRPGGGTTGLFFCGTEPMEQGSVNLDIDFTRAIWTPRIINADFSDPGLSENDHGTLVAMASNLYGHDVFQRDRATMGLEEAQDDYLDIRAVTAKRNVAQSSFNSLVALKSRGTGDDAHGSSSGNVPKGNSGNTADYMKMILKQLGTNGEWDKAALSFPSDVEESESFNRYLTARSEEFDHISYYAQMEFLAKKLYQRPEFYTNLYDKPANLKRQNVAMQAIGLMLDRDIYDSWLRSEMLLSLILEIKVLREQEEVENSFALFDPSAPKEGAP